VNRNHRTPIEQKKTKKDDMQMSKMFNLAINPTAQNPTRWHFVFAS
jgi:hypothetical protein